MDGLLWSFLTAKRRAGALPAKEGGLGWISDRGRAHHRVRRVIDIPPLAALIEGVAIRRVERRPRGEALRQVGVGQEEHAEGDQVRLARGEGRVAGLPVVAAVEDE